ncbi:mechanosensitive ion channel protein MscS [Pelagivirga sediminicola]|uniref:Mechanosensitive ion channel protein MscS n=2 Tax=Pelagivirga sediminicola TaxID=2170575 RepID=A0A2T7GA80_9RHOB|nr:mechanosensitive ion channel protein MscS [Pelagivirga sediminicola]
MRLAALVLALAPVAAAGPGGAQEAAAEWYEAPAEIVSAPQNATDIQRRTPRESVRNFIEVSDAGRHDAAAYFLNLSDLPQDERAAAGADLARQLAIVIDRQLWIDWASLSARPDAMQEHGGANSALAGKARRDLGLKLAQVDGQAYEIRLGRYKAEGADPVWLFTPQTVDNIPVLYRAFGPAWFERHIPDQLTQRVAGLRLWEWILLPLMLGALFGLGWAAQRLVGFVGARLPKSYLRQAMERSRVPMGLVVVAIAAQFMLELGVSFSGPATTILRPFLLIVMVSGIGLTALRVVDAILDRITLRVIGDIDDTRSLDERELYTSIYAVRRIIVLLMVGIAIIVVLSRLNLFDTLGMSLLASAGLLTVLLGIAGQAVLGNIMASLQIALAKPIRIGDSILFEDDWAYVESIFYTFLRLRTWDERRIIVPVKYFVSQPFENWSVTDARILKTITLFLDHKADIDTLREVFFDLAKQDEGVIEPEEHLFAAVTDHTAHGQEMSFYAMSPDPSTGWSTAMRLREKLLAHIRENHPDWWPQERFLSGAGEGSRKAAAAAD